MSTRLPTTAVPRIDVFMLHRGGFLTLGAVSRWQWPLPTLMLTVTARCEGSRVFFAIDDGPEVAYGIIRRLGTTGSSYPFLECSCERSVRYLYVHEGRIACQKCHKLEHPTDLPGQWTRAGFRRVERLRAKLATMELQILRTGGRRRKNLSPSERVSHG
jgi:hypothetical protein